MTSPLSLATDTPVPKLVYTGVLVILIITVLRCTTVIDDFPAWSSDPLQLPAPIIGVTPAISMTLDLLTLLACVCCLIGSKYAAAPLRWTLFLALGCAGVVYHIFTPWGGSGGAGGGGSLANSLAGMHMTASITAAIAIATASYYARVRMLVLSSLSAVVILLALKGVSNYFIEQPEMAQMFAQEKDRYIAAQGWNPGSANALAYERRLMQREATGWFGLSNVYASITGAGLAIFIGLLIPAFAPKLFFTTSLRSRAALILCTLLGALSLVLAGSKGGTAAACIGIVLSILGTWACLTKVFEKQDRPLITTLFTLAARGLGFIVPLGVLGLVALRGVIGERMGELSILFRWFYIQAATSMFANNVLLGVGPGGFKDAYMLAKNPLSPEDVISPHSIFFDLAATLGLGGVAFGFILLALFVFAGKSLFPGFVSRQPDSHPTPSELHHHAPFQRSQERESTHTPSSDLRLDLRLALAPIVLGVLISAWLEQQVATPTSTLIRLGGLLIGGVVAAVISQYSRQTVGRSAMSVAAASGAFVIIAHSQIEMTLTTSGASLWACVLLGLAAAPALWHHKVPPTPAHPDSSGSSLTSRKLSTATRWSTPLVLVAVVVACVMPWLRTLQWESLLRTAANDVAPSTQFHLRAALLTDSPRSSSGDSFELLIKDVEETLGIQIPRDGQTFSDVLFAVRVSSTMTAFTHLESAARVWPTHLDTSRTASRVAIAIYQLASSPPPLQTPASTGKALPLPQAKEYFEKAITLASNLTKAAPSSPAYSWLATILEEKYRQTPSVAVFDELTTALKNAAALAPYEPINFQRLAIRYEASDPSLAANYADKALAINANLRLDPLRQFSEADRARLEAIRSKAK